MLRKKRERERKGKNKKICVPVALITAMAGLLGCNHESIYPEFQEQDEIDLLIPSEPEEKSEDKISDSELVNDDTENESEKNSSSGNVIEQEAENPEKGYNLTVSSVEQQEAEVDCKRIMESYANIYENAEKGEALNVVLSDETILQIQEKLKELGCPVTTKIQYAKMENYEIMDTFLKDCLNKKEGAVVLYEIRADGGVGRLKFSFDGTNMYVLCADAVWNKQNEPIVSYFSYTKIEDWEYTEKGWFCYELCVPDESEVSEIVDGSHMIRIVPLSEEQMEFTKKCVLGIGYQGNNLLCSNWEVEHIEQLDFNGLYEYLYEMKYQEKFSLKDSYAGIPKEEFESLIMEYFPITKEKIRAYAVFDEETETYTWEKVGSNFMLTFFGNSIPEVTKVQKNSDGTIILTVDAVCDKVSYNEAVITHELTIRLKEDGSFCYLGNKILGDGLEKIPKYQYRVSNE